MIFEFLIIFIILTVTGFPIISLLFSSTNITFKLCCAAYFASLLIIVIVSIFLRLGLNINYCIIPFVLMSSLSWLRIYKTTSTKFKDIINLKRILVVGLIIFLGSFILIYLNSKGAYGIFHSGPDFYGYGMSTSYLQKENTISNLKKEMGSVTKLKNLHRASFWNLGDLREAVSIDFIINSNRYGVQSLAAFLGNMIFSSNSAARLLYSLMAISIIATLASTYQLIYENKLKIIYSAFAILLIGLNMNHLVAIIEGHVGSVFSLAMPLLLWIAISSFDTLRKQRRQLNLAAIFAITVLLSSSLVIYQEITGILILILMLAYIYSMIIRDKKNILNLSIAGIVFFMMNFDILVNFILSVYSRFQHQFIGASLNIGFTDIFGAVGLTQIYHIVPHASIPYILQSNLNIYGTVIIYFILFLFAVLFYKIDKTYLKMSAVIILGVFCLSIIASLFVLKNYFIVWKLTYAFLPIIIILLTLIISYFAQHSHTFIEKYFSRNISKKFIEIVIFIIGIIFCFIVVINYVILYRNYIKNSDLIYDDESRAFEKGIYSNRILLTMSENQLYYLPGFYGRLYWLNSGWLPVFDNNVRDQKVILVIFKQIEGEKFFKDANKYFHKSILYSNNKIVLVNLNIPASVFLTEDNKTNRDYMQNFLNILRNKIELQD